MPTLTDATINTNILNGSFEPLTPQILDDRISIVDSFINGVKGFALDKSTTLSTNEAIEQYIQDLIKLKMPIFAEIKLAGAAGAVLQVAIDGAEGGWKVAVKSVPGAAIGWTAESLVLTLGATTLAGGAVGLCVGAVVGSEVDAWDTYRQNIKDYETTRIAADAQGQLKIITYTDNMTEIQNYLNISGFLTELAPTTQIIIEVHTDELINKIKTYEVIRGTDFTNIVNELNDRGFSEILPANTKDYNGIYELIKQNSWLKERYSDGKYRLLSGEHPYLILEQNEKALFPMIGNEFNNKIYADDYSRILYGDKGNDEIHGGKGNDEIYGDKSYYYGNSDGNGRDTLYGGNGSDEIHGGSGDDTIYGDLEYSRTIDEIKAVYLREMFKKTA